MSDFDPENLEERVKEFARELAASVERAADEFDLDALADRIGMTGDRVRDLADFAGQMLGGMAGPSGRTPAPEPEPAAQPADAADAPRARIPGPHPLDVPTDEQGVALSALDSGRWVVKPGTNELVDDGVGPAPEDVLGLVSELRARDWIASTGEVTLVGRDALRRWIESRADH